MWKAIIIDALKKIAISFLASMMALLGLILFDYHNNAEKYENVSIIKYNWDLFFSKYTGVILIIFAAFFFVNLVIDYIKYKKNTLLNLLNFGSISTNKSLMLITENISHELSTPLEVINFKLFKISKIIDNLIEEEFSYWIRNKCKNSNKCICSLNRCNKEKLFKAFIKAKDKRKCVDALIEAKEEIKYIETASEQIHNILTKMKNFKSIKYSNGNKTLFDIIETAFKIMQISHRNFDYHIDEEFKQYKNHPDSLTNADLLNILINHIKNSLEANATKIIALFIRFDGTFLYFQLKDNGSGIPVEFISSLFHPNMSTKKNVLEIRGNGLFINREIIRSFGGNIRLVHTSPSGTIFEIKIKAVKKNDNMV